MLNKLMEYGAGAGTHGSTSDKAFRLIVELLERFGVFVEREERSTGKLGWTELVIIQYHIQGAPFELWYQVRTPLTPEGTDFMFGFEAVKVSTQALQ
jgi:hypothetical protein